MSSLLTKCVVKAAVKLVHQVFLDELALRHILRVHNVRGTKAFGWNFGGMIHWKIEMQI